MRYELNATDSTELGVSSEAASHLSTTLVGTIKTIRTHTRLLPRAHPEIDYGTLPLLHKLAKQPRRVSELAEAVHAELSGVSRQVSTLVRIGLVEKIPDPADGRAWLVALTDEGQEFVQSLRTKRTEWVRDLLSDWTTAEAQEFDRLLDKFAESLLTYEKTYLTTDSTQTTHHTTKDSQ